MGFSASDLSSPGLRFLGRCMAKCQSKQALLGTIPGFLLIPPPPREAVGRARRPSVAVLGSQNAAALHRLCAERRSGWGRVLIPPTLTLISFASSLPTHSLALVGGGIKKMCGQMRLPCRSEESLRTDRYMV